MIFVKKEVGSVLL